LPVGQRDRRDGSVLASWVGLHLRVPRYQNLDATRSRPCLDGAGTAEREGKVICARGAAEAAGRPEGRRVPRPWRMHIRRP
jgi:hypothetical protein